MKGRKAFGWFISYQAQLIEGEIKKEVSAVESEVEKRVQGRWGSSLP